MKRDREHTMREAEEMRSDPKLLKHYFKTTLMDRERLRKEHFTVQNVIDAYEWHLARFLIDPTKQSFGSAGSSVYSLVFQQNRRSHVFEPGDEQFARFPTRASFFDHLYNSVQVALEVGRFDVVYNELKRIGDTVVRFLEQHKYEPAYEMMRVKEEEKQETARERIEEEEEHELGAELREGEIAADRMALGLPPI